MRTLTLLASLFSVALAGAAQTASEPTPQSAAALIDRLIAEKWRDANVKPAKPADDAEFLRRASLDILGTIPPAEEVQEFLNDSRPDKRPRKIDDLLGRPDYARNWAELWEDLLIGYDAKIRNDSKGALLTWLREQCFAKNLPYDQMVSNLVSAKGINVENGATVFLIKHVGKGAGAINAAGKVCRIFLGTQVQCAQCHDHPFDKYTQDDFYGMVAFFAQAASKKVDGKDNKDTRYELYENAKGEASYGDGAKKKTVPPSFLDGTKPEGGKERRSEFARLLVRPENFQFARAAVNRYWGHFFGRGIVHPVDDFSGRFKPSHAQLLDQLARDFIARKYDLQWLIRAITASKTYQLSSRMPKDAAPEQYFTYAQTRALTPEQLLNCFYRAMGLEDPAAAAAAPQKADPKAGNAKEQTLGQLRKIFGDEENVDIAAFNGTIQQALFLMNGQTVNQGMVGKSGRLTAILKTHESPEARLDQIFLSVLCRRPTPKECSLYLPHLAAAGGKREAYEDITWALLNTSEFLFNH